MTEEIFVILEQGGAVITSTQRLSRTLREEFNKKKLNERSASSVWKTPDVIPLNGWIARFAKDCMFRGQWLNGEEKEHPLILSAAQAQVLWEKVIEKYADEKRTDPSVFQLDAMATLASEAWDLIHSWNIPFDEASAAESEDARAFLEWSRSFGEKCAANNWLDPARLRSAIPAMIANNSAPLPSKIIFAGFEREKPIVVKNIIAALKQRGTAVEEWNPRPYPINARMISFRSIEDEIRAAASWTRELLEREDVGTIGIVIPDLDERRSLVERIFLETLAPSTYIASGSASAGLFDISLGISLAKEPVIATAINLLSFLKDPIDLSVFGSILRSPFIGEGEREVSARAHLDAELRKRTFPEIPLETIIRFSTRKNHDGLWKFDCPGLIKRLGEIKEIRSRISTSKRPSAWASLFWEVLRICGWRGERTPDSREFQAIARFESAVYEFCRLDLVLTGVSFDEAFGRLRRIIGATIFQTEAAGARAQIMGALESGGMQFDYLWIAGMSADKWPHSARPNPFIPLSLQIREGIRNASQKTLLEDAIHITERLLGSAPDVFVSYSETEGDRDLLPSPVFAERCAVGKPDVPATPAYLSGLAGAALEAMETLTDDFAPAVPSDGIVEGGARIWELQSICPFRAFAEMRLHSSPVEEPESGITPLDRGTLLHAALQFFWDDVKSHAALIALSDAELEEKIQEAISNGFREFSTKSGKRYSQTLLDLERERLNALLLNWMKDNEKPRKPFVVEISEKSQEGTIGGIRFVSRIDRIDRLEDGSLAVIDYKTGACEVNEWFSERPDKPQLPLYCVTVDGEVAAVAFACLKAENIRFKGIAVSDDILPDVNESSHVKIKKVELGKSLPEIRAEWKGVLEALAGNFLRGDARVDPKEPATTCQYCKQTAFCRKYELGIGKESVYEENKEEGEGNE